MMDYADDDGGNGDNDDDDDADDGMSFVDTENLHLAWKKI